MCNNNNNKLTNFASNSGATKRSYGAVGNNDPQPSTSAAKSNSELLKEADKLLTSIEAHVNTSKEDNAGATRDIKVMTMISDKYNTKVREYEHPLLFNCTLSEMKVALGMTDGKVCVVKPMDVIDGRDVIRQQLLADGVAPHIIEDFLSDDIIQIDDDSPGTDEEPFISEGYFIAGARPSGAFRGNVYTSSRARSRRSTHTRGRGRNGSRRILL
jgi:hypothetical protein